MKKKEKKSRKSVVLDFDGVIHSYTSKFTYPWVISDPPVEGALEYLKEAVDRIGVSILSTRSNYKRGIPAMKKWLEKWGCEKFGEEFKEVIKKIKFPTGGKPRATLYVDDRGYQFKGQFPSIDYIINFKAWNKQ